MASTKDQKPTINDAGSSKAAQHQPAQQQQQSDAAEPKPAGLAVKLSDIYPQTEAGWHRLEADLAAAPNRRDVAVQHGIVCAEPRKVVDNLVRRRRQQAKAAGWAEPSPAQVEPQVVAIESAPQVQASTSGIDLDEFTKFFGPSMWAAPTWGTSPLFLRGFGGPTGRDASYHKGFALFGSQSPGDKPCCNVVETLGCGVLARASRYHQKQHGKESLGFVLCRLKAVKKPDETRACYTNAAANWDGGFAFLIEFDDHASKAEQHQRLDAIEAALGVEGTRLDTGGKSIHWYYQLGQVVDAGWIEENGERDIDAVRRLEGLEGIPGNSEISALLFWTLLRDKLWEVACGVTGMKPDPSALKAVQLGRLPGSVHAKTGARACVVGEAAGLGLGPLDFEAQLDRVRTELMAKGTELAPYPRGAERAPGKAHPLANGERMVQSGEGHPCPVCGRDTTAACTIYYGERIRVNCSVGQTFAPPQTKKIPVPGKGVQVVDLEAGDQVAGADGGAWGFTGTRGKSVTEAGFLTFIEHQDSLAFSTAVAGVAVDVLTGEAKNRREEVEILGSQEYLDRLYDICQREENPAVRYEELERFATSQNKYRKTGAQLEMAAREHIFAKICVAQESNLRWWDGLDRMKFAIPGLLPKPCSVLFHAAGGLGKTQSALGLAAAIGFGRTMRVRGLDVEVEQGPVLWIQNDQNPTKLLEDTLACGLEMERDHKWFIVKRGFQLNHTHQFAQWVRDYKPVLVVVDSTSSSSTRMQVDERDKAFAAPFYDYAEKNGDPGHDGFPACSIIWIHHDNANGEARGSKLIVSAVDEQWHLRKPTEAEQAELRSRSRSTHNIRFIQIKKSRLGREGDLLLVERDADYRYSVEDYTPTERCEDMGMGDPEPDTMVLRILKEAGQEALFQGQAAGMTAKEVWERLVKEMRGQGRPAPSSKTVRRWITRWFNEGLVVEGKPRVEPSAKRPSKTFTTLETGTKTKTAKTLNEFSLSRAGANLECPLSLVPSDPLQGEGSHKGQWTDEDWSYPDNW